MTRKLALTSAMLVCLLAITSASAYADNFNSETTIKGESTGPQVWTIGEDTFKCAKATLTGKGHGGASSTLFVLPAPSECEVKADGLSSKEVELEKFGLTFAELEGSAPEFKAKVNTKNEAGGGEEEKEGEKVKPVEVHFFAKIGIFKVKVWFIIADLSGVNIKNTKTEKGNFAAEGLIQVKHIPFTSNGEAGIPKAGENLEYKGAFKETGAIAE